MREGRNVLRIVGMRLLAVFVFTVCFPLLATLVGSIFGITGFIFGIIGFLIGAAVLLIKVAVVLAVGYLILVGIRALLR